MGNEFTTFLFGGWAFGMVGVSLFGAAYGLHQLPAFAVLGLANETFIWLLVMPLIQRRGGQASWGDAARSFITSPVVLAIIAGLVANITGLGEWLGGNHVGQALLATIGHIAAAAIPLMLIIVGHSTRLNAEGVRRAAPLVAVRVSALLLLALAINYFLVRGLLGLPPIVEAAVFALFILPPPFILPILVPDGRPGMRTYVSNVLSLHTVVSVALFIGYVAVTG